MASRAIGSRLPLGIGHVLVCFLGIISTTEAQSTVSSDAIRGTYVDPNGSMSTVSCASGQTFTTSNSYAACCGYGLTCGIGIGCDGSVVVMAGGNRITWYPLPNLLWLDYSVQFQCNQWLASPMTRIYYTISLDTAIPTPISSEFLESVIQDPTTVEITQVVTVTISSGIITLTTPGTLVVTETTTMSSSDIPAADESITTTLNSSNGSENNTSTTTGDPAPTSSGIYYENPVPETHPRPASGASRAWIAGVVAGPLLALVAGGCLIYWLKRRRQRKTLAESGGARPDVNAHDPPCIQDFGQSAELPGRTSDPPAMCELDATEVHQGRFQGTGGAMRL
ncbi:hypothetical protein QBC32DRAFT_264325 [Pseudoneurospora amorphoporcata]|uniref:Uncharacterized protein n=1 Tax=Pseudoneurospora amorphoporcata TaxID=241081 RepID=A0AAN6SEE7_9PEZI|nr:hypothetical protein QBC32DRAFT_264325 [Pseudoneurospora amorphoporcata]